MKYIQRLAKGCCCTAQQRQDVRDALIGLIANKLKELTSDNPLSMEEAVRLVSEKLDELITIEEPDQGNIATDSDIHDLFGG